MLLHSAIHSERIAHIHGGIGHGAEDKGRPSDIPTNAVLLAIVEKVVFLWVVEIGLECDTRIIFLLRCGDRP